jgi:hypothetical protein
LPASSGRVHDFGEHDYEIVFRPRGVPLEVDINAAAAAPPLRVGDHYTVGRHGLLHDLVVEEIRHLDSGAWNARCTIFRTT